MKKLITLAILFALSIALSSCSKTEYEYEDFSDHDLSSFAEVYNQEGTYIVYYYSKVCSDCASLKQNILSYLNSYDETDYYLIEDGIADDQFLFEDFYVTPTLFIIENGVITNRYLSSVQILEYIK